MKLFFSIAFLLILLPLSAQVNDPTSSSWTHEKFRQFDFWIGEWDVNLRIQQGDGSWKDQVQSVARIYQILDGKAILELWNENKFGEGIKGYSLRYYNEDIDKWELWLNWPGKNSSGSSSLNGSFRHGRGEFFSQFQKNDSVTVTQRYTFCDITPTSLRWDNARSEDGGKTWTEGNWIMEFSRKEDQAPQFSHDQPVHTYDDGNRCDLPDFTFFDDWAGSWKGKMKTQSNGKWKTSKASMDIFPVLDGCGVTTFVNYEIEGQKVKLFSLNTYNTYASKYEIGFMDNQPNSNFMIQYGDLLENELTLVDGGKTMKSVWKKEGKKLSWEQFKMVEDEWTLSKSLTLEMN